MSMWPWGNGMRCNSSRVLAAARSGCVDLILPPDQIARELTRIGQHPHVVPDEASASGASPTAENDAHFKKILEILQSAFGVDINAYRETTVRRKILRQQEIGHVGNANYFGRRRASASRYTASVRSAVRSSVNSRRT